MWGSPHPFFLQILSQQPPETSLTDIRLQLFRRKNGLPFTAEITLPELLVHSFEIVVVKESCMKF